MADEAKPSRGFPPVARADARILLLGSLPGAESLRRQQYYAHPHNGFWRILGMIAGFAPDAPYEQRLDVMVARGIALWDVCAAAERPGSLDSAIRLPVPNDFDGFLAGHPRLERICFNGQTAAKLFLRLVRPGLRRPLAGLVLPSTSPAHATMRFEEKLRRWEEALRS